MANDQDEEEGDYLPERPAADLPAIRDRAGVIRELGLALIKETLTQEEAIRIAARNYEPHEIAAAAGITRGEYWTIIAHGDANPYQQ